MQQYRRRSVVVGAYRLFIAKTVVGKRGAIYHASPGQWVVTFGTDDVCVYPNDLFLQAFEQVEPEAGVVRIEGSSIAKACPVCGDQLRAWDEEYNASIYCANCGYTR